MKPLQLNMDIDRKALKAECDDFNGVIRFPTTGGREAFSIHVINGHTLGVFGGSCIKDGGKIYDERLEINPRSCNSVIIKKSLYGG